MVSPAYFWSTELVFVTRSGTGWTVDVTACRLDNDLSIKDFVVLFNDVPTNNANFTKTTASLLTYTGPSSSGNVEVRRFTPEAPRSLVAYQQRFSSDDYNKELERSSRQIAEFRAQGVGVGSSSVNVLNAPYGVAWDGDVSNAASRNTLYDQFVAIVAAYEAADALLTFAVNARAPLDSPSFSGTPTAPTAAQAVTNTQLATTQYAKLGDDAVRTSFAEADALKANLASPTFTGVPAGPTAAVNTNTTQFATTAFVRRDFVRPYTESAETTYSNSATILIAHGLGVVPKDWHVVLRCKVAENGYAIGDEINATNYALFIEAPYGSGAFVNATNIGLITTATPVILGKTSKTTATLTPANWRVVAYYR